MLPLERLYSVHHSPKLAEFRDRRLGVAKLYVLEENIDDGGEHETLVTNTGYIKIMGKKREKKRNYAD